MLHSGGAEGAWKVEEYHGAKINHEKSSGLEGPGSSGALQVDYRSRSILKV